MPSVHGAPYAAPADYDALLPLLERVLPANPDVPTAFARKVLLDPNFEPEGLLLARESVGGPVRGFVLALTRRRPLEDGPDDRDRGYITLFGVTPEARRQGIGAALFADAEAYLRGRGCKTVLISPYAPNYFTPGVDAAAYPDALAFLESVGYAEASRPLAMDASLVTYRTPEWLAEKERALAASPVTFAPFHPRQAPLLNAFLREHFPGDWQRYIRGTMEAIVGGAPAERLYVASEEGRMLGFAQWENERFGPFGVAESERGRGIGAALLDRTLRTMRAHGLHAAWFLWTDDRTAKLYAEFGFRETRRFVLYRKDL